MRDTSEDYIYFSRLVNEYETLANSNCNEALKKMIDIYPEINKTFFHDLTDSIELWVFEKSNSDTIEYIMQKRAVDPNYEKLLKIAKEGIKLKK